jgi:uncharacterized protein
MKTILLTECKKNLKSILFAILVLPALSSFSQNNDGRKMKIEHIVLSYGSPGSPQSAWYPFLKNEMDPQGVDVQIPQLPMPDLKEWQKIIKPLADKSPAETILIGHSIGCVNLLRYLERTESNERFPLMILVAPPAFNPGYDVLKSFFDTPFDVDRIKSKVNKIVVIVCLQDKILTPDPMKHSQFYLETLGAKLIILPTGGHFASFDNVNKLPELIEEIKLIKK